MLHACETDPETRQLALLLAKTPAGCVFLTHAAAAVFPATSNAVAQGHIPAFATLADVQGVVVSAQALLAHWKLSQDSLGHAGGGETRSPDPPAAPPMAPPALETLDDPFELLRRCPDWFLDWPMGAIAVPTRLANRLRRKLNYSGPQPTLRDVAAVRMDNALRWSGIGRKSLSDFVVVIRRTLELRAPEALTDVAARPSVTGLTESDAVEREQLEPEIAALGPSIAAWVESLAQIRRTAIELRFPPAGEQRATLQELGDRLGVTRERARQVELALLTRTVQHAVWVAPLVDRLRAKLATRQIPLDLATLEDEDSWFTGLRRYSTFVGRAVEVATNQELNLLILRDRPLLSHCGSASFEALRTRVRQELEKMAEAKTPLDVVKHRVSSLAREASAGELAEDLLTDWSDALHFAHPSGSDVPLLVGFGNTTATLVATVLHDAEGPLHMTEIVERIHLSSGRDVSPAQISNVMDKVGAVQFDRGTWGLRSHVPGTAEQHEAIREFLEDLILEASGHQHHCDSLLSAILSAGLEVPEGFTKYSVNAVLSQSSRVADLGRLTFAADLSLSSTDRLNISDVAVDVLRTAGGPLSFSELRHRIAAVRGLNRTFMMLPDERLARVRPGFWGLLERDFFTTRFEQDALREALFAELSARSSALHQSEVIAVPRLSGMKLSPGLTGFMIVSILASDRRFRVWDGGLIGLAEWTEPGRLSTTDAARELIHLEDRPARVEILLEMLEPLVERPLEVGEVKAALRAAGYTYDSDTSLWYPPDEINNDEDSG